MSLREYTSGNELVFTATFTDPATKKGVNPTDVLLKLRDPDGIETDIRGVGVGLGQFTATFTPVLAGIWSYRWQGTGAVVAAREGSFTITATDF